MTSVQWKYTTKTVFVLTCVKSCVACSSDDKGDSGCWYTLWYIWFVLGLFIVVIAVLVVLYIKHRNKERSRARRRRRSTRTIPIHIVPMGPPAYAEPSHKPPTYDEAISQNHGNNSTVSVPGIIPYYTDDYGYQPPPTSMRTYDYAGQPLPPPYDGTSEGQSHPT